MMDKNKLAKIKILKNGPYRCHGKCSFGGKDHSS